jgi:serine/threonine protein kinase
MITLEDINTHQATVVQLRDFLKKNFTPTSGPKKILEERVKKLLTESRRSPSSQHLHPPKRVSIQAHVYTITELKHYLKKRHAKVSGRKAELEERLLALLPASPRRSPSSSLASPRRRAAVVVIEPEVDAIRHHKYTVQQLKIFLKERKAKLDGKKADLEARLLSIIPSASTVPLSVVLPSKTPVATPSPARSPCPYTESKLIAKGGFGRVFRIKLASTGEHLALKTIMKLNMISPIEVIAMRYFDHPNVLSIIDMLHNDNCLLKTQVGFVMPLAIGTLDMWSGKVPPDAVDAMFTQLCHGLYYMHQNNFLHLDIKPRNILIFPGNVFKYADFGLSEFVSSIYATYHQSAKGTKKYYPPEFKKAPLAEITDKADVWALGVTLSETLVGSNVWSQTKEFEFPYNLAVSKLPAAQVWNDHISSTHSPPVFFEDILDILHHMIDPDLNSRKTMYQILSFPFFASRHPPNHRFNLPTIIPSNNPLTFWDFRRRVGKEAHVELPLDLFLHLMDLFYLYLPFMSTILYDSCQLTSPTGQVEDVSFTKLYTTFRYLASKLAGVKNRFKFNNYEFLIYLLSLRQGIIYRPIPILSNTISKLIYVKKISQTVEIYERLRSSRITFDEEEDALNTLVIPDDLDEYVVNSVFLKCIGVAP